MSKSKVETYTLLESQFIQYKDLIDVQVQENDEKFVVLPTLQKSESGVVGLYQSLTDMQNTFPLVPVRQTVKEKLDRVDASLKQIHKNFQLVVAYGYRSLEVQKKYFTEQRRKFLADNPSTNLSELDEVIHRKIAVPFVAGHPTGGAVDVFIQDRTTGKSLDFGTALYDFGTKDIYSDSPFVSQAAQSNRRVLRTAMEQEKFAPYLGEWWHFSFGDKEWASYYHQRKGCYEQKSSRWVQVSVNDVAEESIKKRDPVADSVLRSVRSAV